MKVELSVSPGRVASVQELTVTAHVRNAGGASVHLNTSLLPYPSLMLQARDAAGERVPLGPPPMPQVDDGSTGRKDVAPGGQALTFEYGNPFGSSPPPGKYELRFHYEAKPGRAGTDWQGTLESAWTPFEIAAH